MNTPTSEERAREITIWAAEDAFKVLDNKSKRWIKKWTEIYAKALDAQRKEVARECAEIAVKDVCEGDNDFGAWRNDCNKRIAQAIKEKFDV